MLVYDITNEKSFDNIREWIKNIEQVSSYNGCCIVPALCVGCVYSGVHGYYNFVWFS